MTVFSLVGIFMVAIIITFVFLCVYLKLLSVIADKLSYRFHKTSETRSKSRQDSRIEVYCIKCFDKTYYSFYSSVSFIGRVIKNLIRYKLINKNGYDSEDGRSDKYLEGNAEGFLPVGFHCKSIISGKQPNANSTIVIRHCIFHFLVL